MFKRFTRNMIVAVLAIASALSMGALLAACSSSGGYRDDITVAQLSTSIEACIENSDVLVAPGDSYITGSMQLDPAALGDYVIKISSQGTNIDEYGVFKAADASAAKTLASTLEAYLTMRNEAWMSEYLPDEYPKLRDAEVKSAGSYVMYAILGDSEREAVFTEFENSLKK